MTLEVPVVTRLPELRNGRGYTGILRDRQSLFYRWSNIKQTWVTISVLTAYTLYLTELSFIRWKWYFWMLGSWSHVPYSGQGMHSASRVYSLSLCLEWLWVRHTGNFLFVYLPEPSFLGHTLFQLALKYTDRFYGNLGWLFLQLSSLFTLEDNNFFFFNLGFDWNRSSHSGLRKRNSW